MLVLAFIASGFSKSSESSSWAATFVVSGGETARSVDVGARGAHHHFMGLRPILILAQLSLVGTLATVSHGSLAEHSERSRSPWGLIIQRPPGTEASTADVGDLLTIVGWSPLVVQGREVPALSEATDRTRLQSWPDAETGSRLRTEGRCADLRNVEGHVSFRCCWRAENQAAGQGSIYSTSDSVPLD